MNLPELFIRKPVMTTLVMVVVIAFGIASYFQLPVSSLPQVDYPVIQVNAYYPGASPATMASTVATPLETQFMQIPGLQSIISANTMGSTMISLTFDLDKSVDLAAPDVLAAINRAQPFLPSDLPTQPSYTKNNPADKPIMYMSVFSDVMTRGDIYDYANRALAKKINIINGVSQVAVYGAKFAVRVKVDARKLAAYSLGLNDVAQALGTGTVTIPGGSLDGDSRTFDIEPRGQLRRANEYNELIIAYRNNAPVYLRDVAKCEDSVENDFSEMHYGTPEKGVSKGGVIIAVFRSAGANTVTVAKKIRQAVEDAKAEMPGSVNINVMFDGSAAIIDSINDVQQTILIAIVLVVLVIFLSLGRVRETVIPSIVIPISIAATFALMLASKFTLDNLSLMALVLSVGFLVDDAIVVLENTVRHIDNGIRPVEAAIRSMKEITGTIVSTSVALMIVFVPLVFMSGVVGRNFKEFALTVIFAITCSLLLALTLTPMMCSRVLRPAGEHKTRVQKVIDATVSGLTRRYGVLLTWTLKRKYIAALIWVMCILGSIGLFKLLPKAFLPPGDSGAMFGVMMMQQGNSTAQMKAFQNKVDKVVAANPNVSRWFSGSCLNLGADQSQGMLVVCLKPVHERVKKADIRTVQGELTAALASIPDGLVFMVPIPVMKLSAAGEATAMGNDYSYTMRGYNRDVLYQAADALKKKMQTLKGFVAIQTSVKLNMPQLDVKILRDRASSLGITAYEVENALSLAYAGGRLLNFTTDIDQYNLIVVLDKPYTEDPTDLSSIYLRSQKTGQLIPLRSVVEWKETVGPQNVPHSAQIDAATLSFNLIPGVALGDATEALQKAADETLPAGVIGSLAGQAQQFQSSMKSLVILLFVAIFLMYIVLGILYESYLHPFTVLTTLPVAALGGLATLMLFGSELSLYAYIGMFMLLGIIAKNGIMMVDFAEQGLHEGKSSFEAIHDACLIRFRPILMTGACAVMGALPIALGYGADASSRVPLGLVIVGGMIFAQVITLFVTPGVFLYMEEIRHRFTPKHATVESEGTANKPEA